MLTHNLGFPRIGAQRQLKKASEQYWAGAISRNELFFAAKKIREENWLLQKEAGIDMIPCNDFSFYDQVLDMSLLLGAIPHRYTPVATDISGNAEIDLYFAMARGYQQHGLDITAMEMTKWFDTNYHYIVPEFIAAQQFRILSDKLFHEFNECKRVTGTTPKPVLIGPVSYLLLGKEKQSDPASDQQFDKLDLLKQLLPVYINVLKRLEEAGAIWVQLDEPFLATDLTEKQQQAFQFAYKEIRKQCNLKILLATYFESLQENTSLAVNLPVCALHIDLERAPQQLDDVLKAVPPKLSLSLGVVDGRNIWKNDYSRSLALIEKAKAAIGEERLMLAPSCSLLHTPVDLDGETAIDPEIKNWMAFAKQKLDEVSALKQIVAGNTALLAINTQAIESRRNSTRIHKQPVKERVASIKDADATRKSEFTVRQKIQQLRFNLPLFPTTTIGSFPQTDEIRQLRAKLKKGELSQQQYADEIEEATIAAIRVQEEIGLDVLVHGEFERNDMVEYFGEQLDGFLFTRNGWVQSYGSRCVKPPVIAGDVSRTSDMTVKWSCFAQAQTSRLMKGMLTGPVTILQWSFVRDDQPRWQTAFQIALAIRDEVMALEKAGIKVIQIDEPAIREGLPLRKKDGPAYLEWAVKAFRLSASGVQDQTQIHTHMCYSEFNDIMEHIAKMDADVITIETSRSQMELLEAFAKFKYPNEIGPGVYDIHSPRVPTVEEMMYLLEKAMALLPVKNLWVNPDCGLKTRRWTETIAALKNMVQAAQQAREKIQQPEVIS
jgi:5-methyltetrahydropteroyltriglutamate--homocysteine methyltransferase